MANILTVTLNPAVDISTAVARVVPGPKLRCDPPSFDPGGGGINVSRAIRTLGGGSLAFVALGGPTGQRLAGLLTLEGVSFSGFEGPSETRQSIAITDRASAQQYRFVMPGPEWSSKNVDNALAAIADHLGASDIVVLSGSNPPGVPADFAARLSERLVKKGARLIADTSGAPLRHLVDHPCPVAVLRMDAGEATELAGHPLPNRTDTADFARGLVAQGIAETVIVARGPDGSTLVDADQALHCSRAVSKVVSAVGAGDSFVGAFALTLGHGANMADALRHGTAAASAAVLTEATQLCTRADAELLLKDCELVEL